MNKRTIFLAFVLTAFSAVYGGKYVAEFLEIGTGVRAAGMGGAYVAIGDDAPAIWWNPASQAGKITPQIYLMHSALYASLYQLDAVAYRDKIFGQYVAFSLMRLATDQIPFTREDGFYDYGPDGIPGTGDPGEGNGVWDPGEPVDASAVDLRSEGDYAFMGDISFPLSRNLAWGIAVKFLHQNIGGYTNFGFGADLGIKYQANPNLKFGLSVLDITGTHLFWNTGFRETKLPSLRAGAASTRDLWQGKIFATGTADLEIRFENAGSSALISVPPISIDPHIGVEISAWGHFFARLGVDRRDFTAGAGLKISRFRLDYAFVSSSIDYVHRVSLTVDFNPRLPPGVQIPK